LWLFSKPLASWPSSILKFFSSFKAVIWNKSKYLVAREIF
jgi:hypothetical protein